MGRPAYPALGAGEYLVDPADPYVPPQNTGGANPKAYVISASNSGETISGTITYQPHYLFTTELYVVPAGGQIIVEHGGYQQITKADGSSSNSVIFQQPADGQGGAAGAIGAVCYYPSGTAFTSEGENGTPAAAGQFGWTNSNGQGIFTFDAADVGKEVVIRYMYLNPDYQAFADQFSRSLTFTAGVQGQPASSYMEGSHPDQSIGYSLTALVEGDNLFIGMSGTLPDYSYEVQGFEVVGGGVLDAEPVGCIETLLTDSIVGVGFPAASIDSASWYTNTNAAQKWTEGNSLYLSEAIKNPEPAASVIGRWLTAFNVAAVWSEGMLKLIPYGDQAAGTYGPNNTVVVALTDDDFLAAGKSDPVKMARTPWADAYNRVQVNYRNRENSYNSDLVYEQDEASVERFGLRIKGAESYEFITTWQVASAVANMRLKRNVTVRNTYQFKLPVTFEYLEPMDLVSLSDSRLGLDALVVRITQVTVNVDGSLAVECEDWPGNGYAMPVTNPKAVIPPLHPTAGTAPAGRTGAIILQASNVQQNQTGSRIFIWVGPEDVASWGGCTVSVSMDGSTYEPIGDVLNAGSIYTLTAALPSVTANPAGGLGLTHDTTSQIELSGAGGGAYIQTTAGLSAWNAEANYAQGAACTRDGSPWVAVVANQGSEPTLGNPNWQQIAPATTAALPLAAVSETAAAALANLVAVIETSNGTPTAVELMSYASVANGSTGPTLSDLYRGALGTPISAFSAGAQLVPFAAPSLTWDVPAGLAGQKIYFRFAAWNQKGATTQSIELAEDVTFTVAAEGAVGVWENLAGPTSDVVTASGELIVDPPAGVIGNLPLANHDPTVQAGSAKANTGLDTGGHVIVGTAATPAATIDDGVGRARTGLDTGGHVIVGTAATAVSAIDSGASRANAAIDGTNIVVPGGIDFSRAYTNKNGANLPRSASDGTTLDRAFAKVNAGDADTLDCVPTGSIYVQKAGIQGQNVLENPSFELPAPPHTTDWIAGWFIQSNNALFTVNWENNASEAHSGAYDIDIEIPAAGISVPGNSSVYVALESSKKYAAVPGEVWSVGGWINLQQAAAFPAGTAAAIAIFARAEYSDGSYTQFGDYGGNITGPAAWTFAHGSGGRTGPLTFTVPAVPAGKTFIGLSVWMTVYLGNSNATTTTIPSGAIGVRFDDLKLVRSTDYANEVADGQLDANGVPWNRLGNVDSTNRTYGNFIARTSSDATTLDRAFAKASATGADDLSSIPDDAAGNWRKVAGVSAANLATKSSLEAGAVSTVQSGSCSDVAVASTNTTLVDFASAPVMAQGVILISFGGMIQTGGAASAVTFEIIASGTTAQTIDVVVPANSTAAAPALLYVDPAPLSSGHPYYEVVAHTNGNPASVTGNATLLALSA